MKKSGLAHYIEILEKCIKVKPAPMARYHRAPGIKEHLLQLLIVLAAVVLLGSICLIAR